MTVGSLAVVERWLDAVNRADSGLDSALHDSGLDASDEVFKREAR